jgi:hypothetical protein
MLRMFNVRDPRWHTMCGAARTGDSHLGEDEVGHLNVLGDIPRHVPLQQLDIAGGHCISFKKCSENCLERQADSG